MTAQLLDGRVMAKAIVEEVRAAVHSLVDGGKTVPTLVVVRVGDEPASVRYANQIQRVVLGAGMAFRLVTLPETVDDASLQQTITALGAEPTVTAILLQFPIPPHLSRANAAEAIPPVKDVDGVNPINAGRLFLNRGRFFAPATPLGGLELLRRNGIAIEGRHVVVVGRSDIVGRPLAMLFLAQNATVTVCHSRTPDLGGVTREADILAVAVGRPNLITGSMVAPGAVVLDFGVNVVDGKLVGDVTFDQVAAVAGAITPVPGGTGPMTNAMLLTNTLQAARWQHGA